MIKLVLVLTHILMMLKEIQYVNVYYVFYEIKKKACHFSCSNCTGPDINMCTICSDTNNRYLNDSVCDCKQSYYEIGFSECACIYLIIN